MRSTMVPCMACVLFSAVAYAGDTESAAAANEAQPDATITLKGGSVAAGIGYTWGHGELKYSDHAQPFSIKGVSLVDVGATNLRATGLVYHLKSVADFSGNYVAAGAGITIAGGGTAVYLKNEHGVVIKLIATELGLKFKLSADGVKITLND
jgi:hypothetical protein